MVTHYVYTLHYQSFCASERFQPPGQASTYLKVKGREAWVVQQLESDGEEACRKLPPPMDEVITITTTITITITITVNKSQ